MLVDEDHSGDGAGLRIWLRFSTQSVTPSSNTGMHITRP